MAKKKRAAKKKQRASKRKAAKSVARRKTKKAAKKAKKKAAKRKGAKKKAGKKKAGRAMRARGVGRKKAAPKRKGAKKAARAPSARREPIQPPVMAPPPPEPGVVLPAPAPNPPDVPMPEPEAGGAASSGEAAGHAGGEGGGGEEGGSGESEDWPPRPRVAGRRGDDRGLATSEPAVICRTPVPGGAEAAMPKWKYDLLRRAILANVPADDIGIMYRQLASLVRNWLPRSDRRRLPSLTRDTTRVKLDLEARGEIARIAGMRTQYLRRAASTN